MTIHHPCLETCIWEANVASGHPSIKNSHSYKHGVLFQSYLIKIDNWSWSIKNAFQHSKKEQETFSRWVALEMGIADSTKFTHLDQIYKGPRPAPNPFAHSMGHVLNLWFSCIGTYSHLANGPWKKSLNFIFPTKYGIPKVQKVSHWLSKYRYIFLSSHSIAFSVTAHSRATPVAFLVKFHPPQHPQPTGLRHGDDQGRVVECWRLHSATLTSLQDFSDLSHPKIWSREKMLWIFFWY